jgi:hypothetical protein
VANEFFTRIFGLSQLFKIHRLAGLIIAAVAIAHPILVFIPGR